MIIWIIKEGEPLPINNYNGRLMRAGMLAELFSQKGSEIIWWSSTYLHHEKKYIDSYEKSLQINPNLELKLLDSINGYEKNISFKRIRYSHDLGREFKKRSRQEKKPDIIYCSWPLIDFAYEAIKFGEEYNIPIVVDIRDLWPDIFIQPFPKILQPFIKLGLKKLYKRKVSFVMRNASAVVGVIPNALKFAKSWGRILQPQDHVIYLAYDNTSIEGKELKCAEEFWSQQGLAKDQCIVSYIGTISNRVGDFDTLIQAAEKCTDSSIVFVFCGIGNYYDTLKQKTHHLKNVLVAGYRNKAELRYLLEVSTFGLLAYRNTDDFIDALPNKFGEYLSQGLVVLTSLKGASREIIERENCGRYYDTAESLLNTLSNINQNAPLKEEMAKNALRLFRNEFDASKVYDDFYLFLQVMANNSNNKRTHSDGKKKTINEYQ
ncbi:MAG: glycosyltransferase [Sphaerochaetaceae bacterium]